jgi:alanine-glyoxylate transaminase/(R)-3-amino-2-methylpropionate-pyruvate transaminase
MLFLPFSLGNHELLSFRNSYHGMSPYTMGLTGQSSWKYKMPGINTGIHHIMNPDPYQGLFGGSHCRDSPIQVSGRDCDCAQGACKAEAGYLDQLEEVLKYEVHRGESLAGFFAESIQGVGGTVQYPKGYLKKAFKKVRELGGLCISDEVQTGFGRTGDHFWGFQGHDVVPDIVTMAKGIGNGFPIGAVVTTPEIARVMTQVRN